MRNSPGYISKVLILNGPDYMQKRRHSVYIFQPIHMNEPDAGLMFPNRLRSKLLYSERRADDALYDWLGKGTEPERVVSNPQTVLLLEGRTRYVMISP